MKQNNTQKQPIYGSKPEELKVVRECPLCKVSYGLDDTNVLKEKNGTHLVHATCPNCNSAMLSVVVVSQLGMSSIGVMTDLSAKDVNTLNMKGPIEEDELLEFHSILRKNSINNLIN